MQTLNSIELNCFLDESRILSRHFTNHEGDEDDDDATRRHAGHKAQVHLALGTWLGLLGCLWGLGGVVDNEGEHENDTRRPRKQRQTTSDERTREAKPQAATSKARLTGCRNG